MVQARFYPLLVIKGLLILDCHTENRLGFFCRELIDVRRMSTEDYKASF